MNVNGFGGQGANVSGTHARHFGEVLVELASVSHCFSSFAGMFEAFVRGVGDVLAADFVQLLEYVPGDGHLLLRAGKGFPENLYGRVRIPAALLSQAGRAVLDPVGDPVKLEDFSTPHDWAEDDLLLTHGARSGVAVAIKAGPRSFGALGVFYRRPRAFSLEEEGFFARVAWLLGAGVKRLEGEEAATAWRSRAELLRAGAGLLRFPAESETVMSAAVLAAVSGGAGGSRPIADWCFADTPETNGTIPRLRRVAVDHAEGAAERLEEAFSAPPSQNAAHGLQRVYATRRAELVESTGPSFISEVARDPEHRRIIEGARPCSYVCAPVIGRERFHGALGFLRVETRTPTPYDEADLAACSEFAMLAAEAIDWSLPQPDLIEAQGAIRTHISPVEAALDAATCKEREVLNLIAQGHSMKEIGASLHIDYETVRTHKRHLCQKLGITPKHGNARLIFEAKRRGWLPQS